MTPLADRTITCINCSKPFTFTSGEQDYYKTMKFSDPKRCKECREKKREQEQPRRRRVP